MKHREKWQSASTSDRIVAVSSLAMAVFTVLLTALGAFQWYEIHTGSKDTHELAIAAKTEAENTVKLADAAQQQALAAALQVQELKAQVDTQDKILKKAQEQTEATNRLVAQSARSADSAKQEVEIAQSAQRPWMMFTLNADKPVPGAKFKVTAVALNSGKSPAYVLRAMLAVTHTSSDPSMFKDMPPGDFAALRQSNSNGSQTVVTPGNVYTTNADETDNLPVLSNELVALGREKWYVLAYLTYKDLDTHRVYESRSCSFWDVKSNAWASCHGFDSAE